MGKHGGRLGSIQVQSFDGEVSAWVGGGFSDDEREDFWADHSLVLDRVVSLEYRIVTDLNSLESPQFLAVVPDEVEA